MDVREIHCDVTFGIQGSAGHYGFSEAYSENRSIDSYLEHFIQKTKDSNPDAGTVRVERLWLTKHDSDGKFLVSKTGAVEKEAIWENSESTRGNNR